jgi:hypothetical protein
VPSRYILSKDLGGQKGDALTCHTRLAPGQGASVETPDNRKAALPLEAAARAAGPLALAAGKTEQSGTAAPHTEEAAVPEATAADSPQTVEPPILDRHPTEAEVPAAELPREPEAVPDIIEQQPASATAVPAQPETPWTAGGHRVEPKEHAVLPEASPALDLPPDHPVNILELEGMFRPGALGEVTMPSGRLLIYEATLTEITIFDYDEPTYMFNASYVGLGTKDCGLKFEVQTRNKTDYNKPHPDLYAALLLDRAIRYFNNLHTVPISKIYAHWLPGTDNHQQYWDALQAGPQPPTEAQRIAAAKSTWTGIQAAKHNFTVVSRIKTPTYLDSVRAIFY